jgi:hypothetical protein
MRAEHGAASAIATRAESALCTERKGSGPQSWSPSVMASGLSPMTAERVGTMRSRHDARHRPRVRCRRPRPRTQDRDHGCRIHRAMLNHNSRAGDGAHCARILLPCGLSALRQGLADRASPASPGSWMSPSLGTTDAHSQRLLSCARNLSHSERRSSRLGSSSSAWLRSSRVLS